MPVVGKPFRRRSTNAVSGNVRGCLSSSAVAQHASSVPGRTLSIVEHGEGSHIVVQPVAARVLKPAFPLELAGAADRATAQKMTAAAHRPYRVLFPTICPAFSCQASPIVDLSVRAGIVSKCNYLVSRHFAIEALRESGEIGVARVPAMELLRSTTVSGFPSDHKG